MVNKSSLTLMRESVLKRWVSEVCLKVELRQQECSYTRMHEVEITGHGNVALIEARGVGRNLEKISNVYSCTNNSRKARPSRFNNA